MLATQVPTLICRVAVPISKAVAIESLLTSAQTMASKPASSAARATSWIVLPPPPSNARVDLDQTKPNPIRHLLLPLRCPLAA